MAEEEELSQEEESPQEEELVEEQDGTLRLSLVSIGSNINRESFLFLPNPPALSPIKFPSKQVKRPRTESYIVHVHVQSTSTIKAKKKTEEDLEEYVVRVRTAVAVCFISLFIANSNNVQLWQHLGQL